MKYEGSELGWGDGEVGWDGVGKDALGVALFGGRERSGEEGTAKRERIRNETAEL